MFSTEAAPTHGAIITSSIRDDPGRFNVGGCVALLSVDLSSMGCGAKLDAAEQCRESGCETCTDEPSYQKCRLSGFSACASYMTSASCATGPFSKLCATLPNESASDFFLRIARFFCVTGTLGTGP
jgi:hypothetical protein